MAGSESKADKKSVLETCEAYVSLFGNLAGILTFAAGIYFFFVPGEAANWIESVSKNIEQDAESIRVATEDISADTSRIASALPLWPKFTSPKFIFEAPRTAEFELTSENILNVVVYDFKTTLVLTGNEVEPISVDIVKSGIIPPFESTRLSASVLSEPWLFDTLLGNKFDSAYLCMSGKVEDTLGQENGVHRPFYEERKYTVGEGGNIGALVERRFSTTAFEICD